MAAGLVIMDDDGNEVELDAREAECLFAITNRLDAATVSACPDCRCRIVAAVALVDLLDEAPPHPRSGELVELADEAPTLHLYVIDAATSCEHDDWLDPLFDEWIDVIDAAGPRARS
ncbi:MAG TPA: hypothetical protein VN636_00840 [Acidimicrobiia bacterium]|nr:hypothetical protein [Acidimicrobiia bacterium]